MTARSRTSRQGPISSSKSVLLAAGMVLFAVGFVITLGAFPYGAEDRDSLETLAEERTTSGPELTLFSGIAVSIVGVVIATVGPFVSLLRTRKKA